MKVKFEIKYVLFSIIAIAMLISLFALPSNNDNPTIAVETEAMISIRTEYETITENTTVLKSEETTTTTAITKPTTTKSTTTLEEKPRPNKQSDSKNLGSFKITVYTPYCDGGVWGYQTATGVKSRHLKTCAVDPKVIPLGSEIKVNGLKLKAVDTGSAVKGNKIDIFYDGTKKEAEYWVEKEFGTKHNVYVV